ncbi:MAG: hypothetical protein JXA77_14755 [Bacteroidales bacterium]|nr:hypothetical protein [Bacteroidales bacterium]MBN2818647.1 hypothetical protein [Bacteroidales bacterium]
MRKTIILLLSAFVFNVSQSQVSEMDWELDYQIYLKLANDSNYVYDIRNLFHVNNSENFTSNFVFYPVNPGQDMLNDAPIINPELEYSTLWSALQAKIGGGWIHFSNCIAYAIETRKLDLYAPLLKRPESNWKPNPITETYKRTKKWEYYVPMSQKNAQKEYKIKLKNNELGDLQSLPDSYITMFLNTSQSDYDNLIKAKEYKQLAKIDLVKVLLGANYLGEAQIAFMSNSVLNALQAYSSNILPSVIIFDEFDAASAMSLDAKGYKIENIVFRSSANLSDNERQNREQKIREIVSKINEYNKESFKKSLGNYYKE